MKRDGIALTTEPGNLANKHSRRYSTLANTKAVGAFLGKDNRVYLSLKRKSQQQKPKTTFNHFHTSIAKKGYQGVSTDIKNALSANYYRKDLEQAALARVAALHKVRNSKSSGVKKA